MTSILKCYLGSLPCLIEDEGAMDDPVLHLGRCLSPDNIMRADHLSCTIRFRTELSSVYSQMFFLHNHALVSSVQESRPLLAHFDKESYLWARQLYPPQTTPLEDLDACDQYPIQSWNTLYTQAGLIDWLQV